MASIRKMRNKYYARIRWFVSSGKQEEILIPLKTSSLTSARTRCEKVGNEEDNIKDGILQKFQFKANIPENYPLKAQALDVCLFRILLLPNL